MRTLMGIWLALAVAAWGQEVCGDCDLDGQVTVLDSLAAASHAAGVTTLQGMALRLCDANRSQAVTILDALLVAQVAAALPVPLSCRPAPRSWLQRFPVLVPKEREGCVMTYDSQRGVVVRWGGGVSTGVPDEDLWEWDGAGWTPRAVAPAPPARTFAAMAYDSQRGKSVMFGSQYAFEGYWATTWEWDGQSWSLRSIPNPPANRIAPSMAYDSARGVMVVFGGYPPWGLTDETWEYNGSTWLLRTAGVAPAARYHAVMAYDSARGVCVLFGGDDLQGVPGDPGRNDTWEWDGATWTERFPAASPPPRYLHAMVYDTQAQVTVLFGGFLYQDDTWHWDGVNWTEMQPDTWPWGRRSAGAAYDSTRGVVVLYSGLDNSEMGLPLAHEETWEY